MFLHLEHGFPQSFFPSWILPLLRVQLAHASSWSRQLLLLLWSKYHLAMYCKGGVKNLDWDVPGLKPSQTSRKGITKHPSDFSETMGLVPKKLRDPALLCGFWEGFESVMEIRKLLGMNLFHSHPIPILDFHLKSHFCCDYILYITIISLTSLLGSSAAKEP